GGVHANVVSRQPLGSDDPGGIAVIRYAPNGRSFGTSPVAAFWAPEPVVLTAAAQPGSAVSVGTTEKPPVATSPAVTTLRVSAGGLRVSRSTHSSGIPVARVKVAVIPLIEAAVPLQSAAVSDQPAASAARGVT